MERQGVRQLVALVAAVVFVVAGCQVGASPSISMGSADPVGSPAPVVSDSDLAGTCPNFVDVVETGPEPTDMSENGPIPQNQQRLSHDIDAAIAYGADHPNEFASVRFENTPRVRIVVGFTDSIDVHCAALRALFQYPDEFEIIQQPKTSKEIEQIQEEIGVLAEGRLRYSGIGAGTIDVGLRADSESIAEQIRSRYGDLVTIQLGLQGYPPGRAPAPDCAAEAGPIVAGSPLTATLNLDTATVRSGEDFDGTATVTNRGDAPVEFESGEPMTAFVYRRGTDQIVGAYDGGIGGTGLGGTLAPGASMPVSVVGGTASCLPDLGFALPPGDYDVRAAIAQYEHPTENDVIIRYLISEPAALTVTP